MKDIKKATDKELLDELASRHDFVVAASGEMDEELPASIFYGVSGDKKLKGNDAAQFAGSLINSVCKIVEGSTNLQAHDIDDVLISSYGARKAMEFNRRVSLNFNEQEPRDRKTAKAQKKVVDFMTFIFIDCFKTVRDQINVWLDLSDHPQLLVELPNKVSDTITSVVSDYLDRLEASAGSDAAFELFDDEAYDLLGSCERFSKKMKKLEKRIERYNKSKEGEEDFKSWNTTQRIRKYL